MGVTTQISVVGVCLLALSAKVLSAREETFSFDTSVRTKHILKMLQGGVVPLEILEEKLAEGVEDNLDFKLAMKGATGDAFVCAPEITEKPKKTDASALGVALPAGDESADKRLSVLEGACTVLSRDWWSYEWCHRKEVRQFHLSMPTHPTEEPVRDPDWSLGTYQSTKVIYEEGGDSVASVIDYFAGGQMCYEINKGRSTQIHFHCCTSDKLAPEVRKSIKELQPLPFAVAQLANVVEVSTCNYTMTVCTPLLCGSDDTNGGPLAGSKVLKLLEPMHAVCVTRHEGYWSYEFCYKKGLRQFHTVAMRDSKGRTFSKVDNEFFIGVHTDIPEDFNEEKHVFQGKAEGDPTYFELEYTQGTSCDLTGQLRATTVQFICGEAADQFVSIKEDRSCHYKAVISTPRLCRHPAFAKELPSSHKITCEPQVVE